MLLGRVSGNLEISIIFIYLRVGLLAICFFLRNQENGTVVPQKAGGVSGNRFQHPIMSVVLDEIFKS